MVTDLMTLFKWFGASLDTVTTAEATRRAAICCMCPNNEKAGLAQTFGEAAHSLIGLKKWLKKAGCTTEFDSQLQVCNACKCPLKIKVWVPEKLISMSKDTKEKLDEYCWMKKL